MQAEHTPKGIVEFEEFIDSLIPSPALADEIKQHAREQWRRGYLHGQREMKSRLENSIASIRLEDADD